MTARSSESPPSPRYWRYGITAVCVLIALAVRLVLDPVVGSGQMMFSFILAIVVAAHFEGRGPGLFATALSVPAVWYFLIEPRFSFRIANFSDVGLLLVLAATGAVISLVLGREAAAVEIKRAEKRDRGFLNRTLFLGGAVLVLFVVTSLLYADFAREKERRQWVTHTYQVLDGISALLSNLDGAETGQRGFLLTGDESYREPFLSALREERQDRQSLRRLTADNRAQQRSLDTLDRLVEATYSELRKTMTLRQEKGQDAVLVIVRAQEGKRIMDQCRILLGVMEERERQLLAARIAAADDQTMRMRWFFGLGSASLMMLLVAASGIIERDSRAGERARRTIAQSEERFHLALDAAKAGAWEWDLETGENIWSEELWELYGLAPHSVLPSYSAWREVIHPDDWTTAEREVLDAARAEAELNVEFRVRGPDGSERWLMARGRPFRHGNGHLRRYAGIVMDITRRKRAEDEMRARSSVIHAIGQVFSEAISCETEAALGCACLKIAETLTASKFGFIGEIGVAGRLDEVAISDRGWDACDINREPGVRKAPISFAIHGIYGKVIHDAKGFYTNDPANHPDRIGVPEGHPALRAFLGIPLIGAEKVIGMIGLGNRENGYGPRDLESLEAVGPAITQALLHKRAEAALRNVSEQRRLALEAAALGAWDYRFDRGEVLWDAPCRNMFGFPAGSRIDYGEATSRIHPEEREAVRDAVNQALAGANGGVYNTEFRVVWPAGSVHWIASHGRVHFEKDSGWALRFSGVNMDITARKEAELKVHILNSELEQRVRQRTAQLETANKEMEAFAYSVAHDLRAPLRGIDGWSLALFEDYADGLDDRAKGYIETVRFETQRMGLLIDDMLKLSQVTRAEMQFRPVDLTAIAQSIATGLFETNPGRHIQFIIEPGLTALGDARLLEIALTNLLANAVKFTGPRPVGCIEFAETSHNGQKAFCIRDNGVGFDMAYSSSLFRAFQRLHKLTEFPGTGVGLATVQRVIRRHSGKVWVEAQVDRGAAFYFTIGETA